MNGIRCARVMNERKVVALLFAGDLERFEEFGAYDSKHQVGFVYRFLFSVLDPDFFLKKLDRLWKFGMSGGRCEVIHTDPTSIVTRLSDYEPCHVVHCHDVLGSIKGLLELFGLENGHAEHTVCRFEGSAYCEYSVRW